MEQQPSEMCPVGGCGCVGYAYVPIQLFGETYSPETGLQNGTVFPELNLTIDEYGKLCRQIGGIA